MADPSALTWGCEGVVVLPPYYYRKASDWGVISSIREIINKAVPIYGTIRLPHPWNGRDRISNDLLARAGRCVPKSIAGQMIHRTTANLPGGLGRIGSRPAGIDRRQIHPAAALESHAQGCITAPANLISPGIKADLECNEEGKNISTLQERVTEISNILEKIPLFPPALKVLLAKLHGFPLGQSAALVGIPPESSEKLLENIPRLSDERSLAPGHRPLLPAAHGTWL